MAMSLILLADEVAVLCTEKLLIPLPSWSLPRVCPYPVVQEEQQYCICSKVICFHNTQTVCVGRVGNMLQRRCVVGLKDQEGFPSGSAMLRRELHPPWGL